VRGPQLSRFGANYVGYLQPSISDRASLDGVDTLAQSAGLSRNCQCRPDSADIPNGETAVRRELLHLLRDFSVGHLVRQ
jgi:hypothetical protein